MSQENQVAMLDAIAFREWLEARRDQVVGRSANEECCPLARFLSETCGVPYVVNGNSYYLASCVSAEVSLPAWATTFIYGLDFTYAGDEVLGEDALNLLFHAAGVQDGTNEEYCWMHTPGGWTCVTCRLARQLRVQAEAIAWYAYEKGFPVVQTVRTHRFMIVGNIPNAFVEPFSSYYAMLQDMIAAFNGRCPFLSGPDGVLVTRLL